MTPLPVASPTSDDLQKRKARWDWVTMLAAVIAALAGLAVAGTDKCWKWASACLLALAGCAVALSRLKSVWADDGLKKLKSTTDEADKKERAEQAANLKAAQERAGTITKRVLKEILQSLRTEMLLTAPDQIHKLRITLFIHDESESHLRIFLRGGANEKSGRCWPVVKDELPNCRGIAGWIWCEGVVKELEVTVDWDDDSVSAQSAYAQETNLTVEEAKSLRTKSVAFLGTVVEVADERWGVLLLDWETRGHLSKKGSTLMRWAKLIGKVLREGKL